MTLLSLQNVVVRREQAGTSFELKVPDLSIEAGSFVSILGESGCGKSTFLDLIALVLRPAVSGRFLLSPGGDGNDIDIENSWAAEEENHLAWLRSNYLGYVLQTGGLLPFLTIMENVQLPVKIKGEGFGDEEIEEMADRLGIRSLLSKKPQYLSGGQRQRAAILRALSNRPEIVLADEPTAAVDNKRAESIVKDFTRLAQENGITILMATHNHELVKHVADAVVSFQVETIDETSTRSESLVTHR